PPSAAVRVLSARPPCSPGRAYAPQEEASRRSRSSPRATARGRNRGAPPHSFSGRDDRDPELRELFGRGGSRCAGQGVGPRLRLRERGHVADRLLAGEKHHEAVDAPPDATGGRRPETEPPDPVAEPPLLLLR